MTPVLEVRDLVVCFPGRRRWLRPGRPVRAVNGVSFSLEAGETLGLVGESGSGKSTTARAMLRLIKVERGTVRVGEHELSELSGAALRGARSQIQMVFQDPYSSLDPSMRVGESVGEPLEVHERLNRQVRDERVTALLERVGLRADHAALYPSEFSGGQRQRIAIARAIAAHPKVVVCDESVSALDVSTQNQIIALLENLQADFGMSYVFIAHDLAVVRHIAHRVAVMYLGAVVETGPTERVFTDPAHPYTRALLSAIPVPNPTRQSSRQRIRLEGDIPDPANVPTGCSFHPRCPFVMERCKHEAPPNVELVGGGSASCHLLTEASLPTATGRRHVTNRPE